MAKPKPRDKEADPGREIIRNMPPRSRAGAVVWLQCESGAEPMLFEMAVARGLIEWLPVIGQWAGSLFGKPEEAPAVVEDVPAPAEPVEVVAVKRIPVKPVRIAPPVAPSGQLELF